MTGLLQDLRYAVRQFGKVPGLAAVVVISIPFGKDYSGTQLSAEQVRVHVRGLLAGYKTPRVVEFSRALPREDSGKIFKRRLREPYWEGRERAI